MFSLNFRISSFNLPTQHSLGHPLSLIRSRFFKSSRQCTVFDSIKYEKLQKPLLNELVQQKSSHSPASGAWWLSFKFGALCPGGRRFESHSSRHIGTLGKSFIHKLPVALWRVNSDKVSML